MYKIETLQLSSLHCSWNKKQIIFGNPKLNSIYGAGCIKNPKLFFLFMNPTARNVSANPLWKGFKAPWLGTKNIWKLYCRLNLINQSSFNETQSLKATKWTEELSLGLYRELSNSSVYVTNLAKCTQDDARPLKNHIFREYLELLRQEIYQVNPKNIISFGNQVSSILLNKPIKVSDYDDGFEEIVIEDRTYKVFPTYYPVGQGMRNMDKAVQRISQIVHFKK